MVSLDRIRADWTRLGDADPLWAVLVSDDHRHGRWDLDEFLATGRAEIDVALARAVEHGVRPGRRLAVDLGCGVGRLSAALATHADEVVGVDISPTMLAHARALDRTGRVRFVQSDGADLAMLADGSVDIAYSALALQHVPAPHNRRLLAELMRVLAPGGLLVAQLADAPDHSVRGVATRVLPRPALRLVQRRVLGYPAPIEMHPLGRETVDRLAAEHGLEVLTADADPMYGGHWIYVRYFLTRR